MTIIILYIIAVAIGAISLLFKKQSDVYLDDVENEILGDDKT